jgi:signal transduction histidine kinase
MLLWEKVLRDNYADDASRGRALDAIHQSVVMQARLVGDLLDVARGISGKLYLDIRIIDMEKILTDALEGARPIVNDKSIYLVTRSPDGRRDPLRDATRLRQVLTTCCRTRSSSPCRVARSW